MGNILLGIESQPDFPKTDVSADNARILTVMLLNPHMLKIFHESAESVSRLFVLGHIAVMQTVNALYDADKVRAASIGASVYEAVSALVQTNPTQADIEVIAQLKLLPSKNQDELSSLLQDSLTDFCSTMPYTAEVIDEVARPLVSNATYAMLGASVARSIELTAA